MKRSRIINALFSLILVIGLLSCKEKQKHDEQVVSDRTKVVSFDNKMAFKEFKKLNLDSLYSNLLDPRKVTKEERQVVIKSWSKFHEKISEYTKKENFKWEVLDSTVKISNKIYFDKNGNVQYYYFKILNPNVTSEKRIEYEKLLLKFSVNEKIDLQRENKFAQCGNIKYRNY